MIERTAGIVAFFALLPTIALLNAYLDPLMPAPEQTPARVVIGILVGGVVGVLTYVVTSFVMRRFFHVRD